MIRTEIRKRFVEHYQNIGFESLPRAPMLHPSIPLSFVMSAGLVQVETSLMHSQHRLGNRFVLVQDCFRHFDLKSIGTDDTHLSLFEMPGAFMFGADGHEAMITWMWEFITQSLGIDTECIWVSYFNGDMFNGHSLPRDEATYNVWRAIGIPENRLIGLGLQDNYWIQGNGSNNGTDQLRKCGPYTEFFYDLGAEYGCQSNCRPGCNCGRFIEFANSLFIFNSFHPKTNQFMPQDDPYSETVIGTERVAMLLQGVSSVFETHDYSSVVEVIHQHSHSTDLSNDAARESERVLADHLRALYILIGEGAPPPGKDGRKRIVKLLIRNVITRQILLGITEEGFLRVIKVVFEVFSEEFDTVHSSIEFTLKKYFESEKQRFEKTIKAGRRELTKAIEKNKGQTLSGSQMIYLEKQKGLPAVLIRFFLQTLGLSYSEKEYDNALFRWREGITVKQKSSGVSA